MARGNRERWVIEESYRGGKGRGREGGGGGGIGDKDRYRQNNLYERRNKDKRKPDKT